MAHLTRITLHMPISVNTDTKEYSAHCVYGLADYGLGTHHRCALKYELLQMMDLNAV